jgi:uncharacterized protein (UPF0548 family)
VHEGKGERQVPGTSGIIRKYAKFEAILLMLVWFKKEVDLARMLEKWHGERSNYDPEEPKDKSWYVDEFTVLLGKAADDRVFERASLRLMRYRFYPTSVLQAAAAFIRERRVPRIGEYIVQRVKVIPGLVDAVTMNIVTDVRDEPDSCGFTIVTSNQQYEKGEWSAYITRDSKGNVILNVRVVSKPATPLPFVSSSFARALQRRAHRLALNSFSEAISGCGIDRKAFGV